MRDVFPRAFLTLMAVVCAAGATAQEQAGGVAEAGAAEQEVDRKLPPIEPPSYETLDVHEDGSRTLPIHLINLYDEYDQKVSPHDPDPRPFSTKVTCGKCHDYETIRTGWHFNALLEDTQDGRRGEPWFYVNEATGTQLPLSNRSWEGVWKPEDIGLTPWDFVKEFGRHMPGGGMGEVRMDPPNLEARWHISGSLEINCLACHNASHKQDQSEYAKQVARENFKWAATGASGFAFVDGVAANLSDTYDPVFGADPDNAWAQPPSCEYNPALFDPKNRVFADIVRKPNADRCYFCHSTWDASEGDPTGHQQWREDGDVHLNSGLTCADCHRNGLGHDMVRGFEGEDTRPPNATLTCRNCHIAGEATGVQEMAGRLGAPLAQHKGLPETHIEKITCTACHSGPWPDPETHTVRTSRANRLGIHGRAKWYTEAPYIASPVFAKGPDGKTGVYNAMYPAYWARLEGGQPVPMDVAEAEEAVQAVLEEEAEMAAAAAAKAAEEAAAAAEAEEVAEEEAPETVEEPEEIEPEMADERLTPAQIAKVLTALSGGDGTAAPAYVCNGSVYTLDASGSVKSSSSQGADALYMWPIAHDVRPAGRSLGANGCTDCHAEDAPFFFASLETGSPAQVEPASGLKMYELQQQTPALLAGFVRTVWLRELYVPAGVVLAALLAFVLLRYLVLGGEAALRCLVAPTARKGN